MASTIWKGQLTFGLVSIPVKLFRAARAEKIHMHHLQRGTGNRVRQVFVPAQPMPPAEEEVTGEKVVGDKRPQTAGPRLAERPAERVPERPAGTQPERAAKPAIAKADLVRGYEYEKDKFVEFEPEELESLAPKSSPEMQIVEFVRFGEVDPIYLESSYYVAPDAGGAKPYALLFEALKKTGYAAIAEFVMHRRDQTMILRPGQHGVIGHTLFYEDEVRRENEFHADPGTTAPKEMELAVKLVEALAAPFDPARFKDKYRERLQQAIAGKVETGAARQVGTAPPKAPVVDIMAALKESLAHAKKPVARESGAGASKQAEKRGRTRGA